jgi:peroxiredoxin
MLLASIVLAAALGDRLPWTEGEPLPVFQLPTSDGGPSISLASFRGKKLLLVEFASW